MGFKRTCSSTTISDAARPATSADWHACWRAAASGSFWAVEALAAMGRWDDAHARMDELCGLAPALGLLAEEVDPATRSLLGNYPQTLTHLSLITAALALANGPR